MAPRRAGKRTGGSDFRNQKHRVGRAGTKLSTTTDTSFKAKGIIVKSQTLALTTPCSSKQVPYHVEHLSSRSESQRKQALAALATNAYRGHYIGQSALLRCFSLLIDTNNAVREQLLKLLYALPNSRFKGQAENMTRHLHVGLTHIAVDVKSSALDFLNCAIQKCGMEIILCSGGWYKTLKCLMLIFGWDGVATEAVTGAANKDTRPRPDAANNCLFGLLNKNPKLVVKALITTTIFLQLGLSVTRRVSARVPPASYFDVHIKPNLLPATIKPLGFLQLFGEAADDDHKLHPDIEERRALLSLHYLPVMKNGIEKLKGFGGEIGRAARSLEKVVTETM